MAAADLTTLANAKQWINLTGSDDDALLARLITSVSNFIQSWLNRNLSLATYSDTYNGHGGQRLMLTNYPVLSVASVSIDNVPIQASTNPTMPGWDFDQYGIFLIGGQVFARGAQNVTVTYTAGYAQIPVEIEQACIELVSVRYSERLRPGVSSKSLAGESVAYQAVGMTDSVTELLGQYKKVVPV